MRFDELQSILNRLSVLLQQEAQNVAEYALTLAMVGLGTIAGMQSLALGITQTFTTVSTTLANHLN